jgi:hypothetical protein
MKMYGGVEIELHAFLTSPLVGELLYAVDFMWTEGWEGFRAAGCYSEDKYLLSLPGIEPQFLSCSLKPTHYTVLRGINILLFNIVKVM